MSDPRFYDETEACQSCWEETDARESCCIHCGAQKQWAKSLRQLIEEAQDAISTFKNPNVDDVQERLHAILIAGDLGGIIHDRLESLSYSKGMLRILTSYYVRGCDQTGEFEIPETVIDAEDPFTQIKVWAKDKRVAKIRSDIAYQKRVLESYEESLAKELAK